MRTLGAQSAVALSLLVFAFFALRVARAMPRGERAFQYGWALTGATFLLQGVNMTLHCAFAVAAFRAGPGSRLWNAAGSVHPVMNHSRTFMLTAYCVVLAAVLFQAARGRALLPLRVAFALVVAGMLAGGGVGLNEGAFSALSHYTAVAVWDIMELLALMGLLFVGLTTGRMDRGLWASLGVNAFVLALSVLWFAYLSRLDVVGQWSPKPYHIHLSKAVLYVVMISIARRQWLQMRQGRPARAFVDLDPRRAMASLHG